jgi:hypothetical protein
MANPFESNLVGRTVTPFPAGQYHVRDDLPQGVVYRIHTVYLKENEPAALAEKIDVVPGLTSSAPLTGDDSAANIFTDAPKSVELYVSNLGQLWELLPS